MKQYKNVCDVSVFRATELKFWVQPHFLNSLQPRETSFFSKLNIFDIDVFFLTYLVLFFRCSVLLMTLIYFSVKYFMLKTIEEHKKLILTQIMKHSVSVFRATELKFWVQSHFLNLLQPRETTFFSKLNIFHIDLCLLTMSCFVF